MPGFAVALVDGQGLRCSGTLIAPNVVLTGRHCFASVRDPHHCALATFDDDEAEAGANDVFATAMPERATGRHHVARVVVPPDRDMCGADIALAILDDVIPRHEAIAITPILHALPDAMPATVIGFAGGWRKTTLRKVFDAQVSSNEMLANSGAVRGDSGSGAYVACPSPNARVAVAGVLSRARSSDAVYETLDDWAPIVRRTVREAALEGGYPEPDWAVHGFDCEVPQAEPRASDGCSGVGAHPPDSSAFVLFVVVLLIWRRGRVGHSHLWPTRPRGKVA